MLLFVSRSGYDFGYLVKILTCSPLPPTEAEFFDLLELWFPSIYDIKHIMRSCKSLKGGLQDVADSLQVRLHFNSSQCSGVLRREC
jgi:CCR4-NOT transcription complex subunit 7/8